MTTSEARKRQEEHDAAVLREAERLSRHGRALSALRCVYPTADWLEASALLDALEDQDLLK